MKLTRRMFAGVATAAFATLAAPAFAQDWKAKYPEIVFAIVPAENASGVNQRYGAFVEYLSKQLGTKVTLRIAADYAAVIEGQRAGNIHIGSYGPSSFARALTTGAKLEAFAQDVNLDGSKGYYSVIYVKASSPFKTLQDLQGKNLGLVDPNSTSGNNVPLFEFNKMGIDPDKFFAKVTNTGSHENAVLAVQQGTVDAGSNWWNDEQESNLLRMSRKGMVKAEDFRIVHKSAQIVNSPTAYLADMPADLKAKIKEAFFNVEKNAPDAWKQVSEGKIRPWEAVDNKAYDTIIQLNKFVDDLRKKRGS
jgi:phosphonate transport system substrate-binding protein